MRFPVNAIRQKRCPVCQKVGPGTNPPATPRPETASLSFAVYHTAGRGQTGPVVLGGDLYLGWDAGMSKHPQSRTSLGASLCAAKTEARTAGEGFLQEQFCSIACLRQFLLTAVEELERRAGAVGSQVQAAPDRGAAEAEPNARPDRGRINASRDSRSTRRRGR